MKKILVLMFMFISSLPLLSRAQFLAKMSSSYTDTVTNETFKVEGTGLIFRISDEYFILTDAHVASGMSISAELLNGNILSIDYKNSIFNSFDDLALIKIAKTLDSKPTSDKSKKLNSNIFGTDNKDFFFSYDKNLKLIKSNMTTESVTRMKKNFTSAPIIKILEKNYEKFVKFLGITPQSFVPILYQNNYLRLGYREIENQFKPIEKFNSSNRYNLNKGELTETTGSGEYISKTRISPGMSGSPLIEIREEDLIVRGVAKSYNKLYNLSYFSTKEQISDIIESFLLGKRYEQSESKWFFANRFLQRRINLNLTEIPFTQNRAGTVLIEKIAYFQKVSSGNGFRSDGGNGIRSDGGNGFRSDGGGGLRSDGSRLQNPSVAGNLKSTADNNSQLRIQDMYDFDLKKVISIPFGSNNPLKKFDFPIFDFLSLDEFGFTTTEGRQIIGFKVTFKYNLKTSTLGEDPNESYLDLKKINQPTELLIVANEAALRMIRKYQNQIISIQNLYFDSDLMTMIRTRLSNAQYFYDFNKSEKGKVNLCHFLDMDEGYFDIDFRIGATNKKDHYYYSQYPFIANINDFNNIEKKKQKNLIQFDGNSFFDISGFLLTDLSMIPLRSFRISELNRPYSYVVLRDFDSQNTIETFLECQNMGPKVNQ